LVVKKLTPISHRITIFAREPKKIQTSSSAARLGKNAETNELL